jgi:hypothetical protein
VTYARRLGTAITALGFVEPLSPADDGAKGRLAGDVAAVAAYVACALEAAKAHVMRGAPPSIPAAPVLRAAPEGPTDRALERIVRWSALVAGVTEWGKAPEHAP